MKRILKTVLAIGLVASSSLAVAEGKFAYRQQLKGVDASPTFGMTEQEKQEHLSNVEMCSNEGVFETGEHEETIIYNVEITLEAGVPVYNKDFGTYWQVQNCSAYPAGQAYPRPHVDGKRVDNSLFIRGD
ncbi:hypothetical protein [Vreelandella lionensis]|uniref:hypothetical protein n=1 Tax=Vreelandella lionensis TaxID=1144478 RepID=UPI0009F4932A|nr:hypothetical protein [Halomonas lionensis]